MSHGTYETEQFRIVLEQIALIEYHYECKCLSILRNNIIIFYYLKILLFIPASTNSVIKIKCLNNCLELFIKCKYSIQRILEEIGSNDQDYIDESAKLTTIFIQRVQFVLKNLVKLYSNKKK